MTLLGKNSHFHAQNFWWLFLVIDHSFQVFPYLYCVWHHMTLSWREEKPLFKKIIPWWHLSFTQFVLSHASDNTTSQNIKNIGGTDAWAISNLTFLGGRPPAPQVSAHALEWLTCSGLDYQVIYDTKIKVTMSIMTSWMKRTTFGLGYVVQVVDIVHVISRGTVIGSRRF